MTSVRQSNQYEDHLTYPMVVQHDIIEMSGYDINHAPDDLIYRLRKRAEIRRQITTRKSVQNGEPDRIADLLEEAADALERTRDSNADNVFKM